MVPDAIILVFLMLSFKLAFSLSSFTLMQGSLFLLHFLPLEWYLMHIWGCWYFSRQCRFWLVIRPACASSSPAFHMVYSAYKLIKKVDNIQPWLTPFTVLTQSIVPCLVLTVVSWPAYRFLRRQVRYSGIPISLRIYRSFLSGNSHLCSQAWWTPFWDCVPGLPSLPLFSTL